MRDSRAEPGWTHTFRRLCTSVLQPIYISSPFKSITMLMGCLVNRTTCYLFVCCLHSVMSTSWSIKLLFVRLVVHGIPNISPIKFNTVLIKKIAVLQKMHLKMSLMHFSDSKLTQFQFKTDMKFFQLKVNAN